MSIDLNSTTKSTDRINYLIDQGVAMRRAQEEPRDYLGVSILGTECDRALQYIAAGREQTFPPKILRIFERGNNIEEMARGWMNDAGFTVCGDQTSLHFEEGKIKGHIDGAIISQHLDEPHLWECKGLKDSSWKDLKKNKLRGYKYGATYIVQIHVYMKGTGLRKCVFTAVNADTMELYHEIVDYDAAIADQALERGRWVLSLIDMEEWAPRCTQDENYFKCKKMCDFYSECWNK